jgi:hypothetical protein
MIELPLADKAYVPPDKILAYLLNLKSRDGKGKAIFFLRHGFHEENWRYLADQLIELAQREPVFSMRDSRYGGKNYEIRGVIGTPQGRLVEVKSIWHYEIGMSGPQLLTAHSLRRSS